MSLREFRTLDGIDVRIWRSRRSVRCTFMTGDKPAKCPHCSDKVPPGHVHSCEELFGGNMSIRANQPVKVFTK